MASRDGAVARALASHQCVPGSSPTHTTCGLSFLLVLASKGFFRHFQIPIDLFRFEVTWSVMGKQKNGVSE